ncbi:outer membrane beta-barrel protein [Pontiella sulfatireligans]|uniref:Outer membrane protein beta-barrel domain-containing protein n=1 Tax=Pontiella sulfatireligans TaxID=2750658 RepID=A0A6C2UMW6_9BACT|nr:outer membrane beta-barrel protein [Pontiella sulfatireligans]VGO21359.1 hypothetical protein SCARR_03431 [Pontiella sulfatireligans]
MNKQKLLVLIALGLASGSVFAAQERVIKVQNQVRLGYDDNVYATDDDEIDSAYITDIINISAKLNFSSRTDMLLHWQPEFKYWFDVPGDEFVTYQDVYARLNHAVSQRTFVMISDHFRYQDKEGQSGDINSFDQSYIENDLMGSVDYTINAVSQIKVGGGYMLRVWDEDDYGKGEAANNFDKYTANGSYIREVRPNETKLIGGANYTTVDYEGSRGGYDSVALFGGVDQNFNPNLTGFGRFGYSFSTVTDTFDGDYDTSNPYLQTGLEYNPTARSSFNGSIGYTISQGENSGYNAQDDLTFRFGARHDITAKISLAGTASYTFSKYESDYARIETLPTEKEQYLQLGIRASYQINRNNFVDAGYMYTNRDTDKGILADYDRNRMDIGWRIRL